MYSWRYLCAGQKIPDCLDQKFSGSWFGVWAMDRDQHSIQFEMHSGSVALIFLCTTSVKKFLDIGPCDATARWFVKYCLQCFLLFAVHNKNDTNVWYRVKARQVLESL